MKVLRRSTASDKYQNGEKTSKGIRSGRRSKKIGSLSKTGLDTQPWFSTRPTSIGCHVCVSNSVYFVSNFHVTTAFFPNRTSFVISYRDSRESKQKMTKNQNLASVFSRQMELTGVGERKKTSGNKWNFLVNHVWSWSWCHPIYIERPFIRYHIK